MKQLQGSGLLFAGTAVALLAAQPVWAKAAKVTGVRLSQTDRGLNVVLATSTGDRSQIFTSNRGNALIADIINTQLRLPQGNKFRQDNPAPGIASIVVKQMDSNSVRLVINGTNKAPSGQIAQNNQAGITLSISPASGTTAQNSTLPAVTRAKNAASPQPTVPQAQRQPERSLTAQKPNVLVPNPKVTIDGVPTAAGATQPETSAVPFVPRAVAPPVGDMAVSNTDSSPAPVDLGTNERVPRLVLRDAPAREVLAILARAAHLNLAFMANTPGNGQQNQSDPNGANNDGPKVSLDIENESVQDVFNYVLRISGLQANRNGRTILVGPKLPNEARAVTVRSVRLNQVTVGVALNFLVAMGAESAVSRERTITSVNAVPVGGSAQPVTQTQTSTETRIETQRIDFQDSTPLLRGLQAVGDERTNSVTLVGSPKQLDVATAQLIQLDSRRRQVAVNVKILDVNLLATEDFNTSFSFGIGDSFFSNDGGAASVNFGGINPPSRADFDASRLTPTVTLAPFPAGADTEPFLDAQPNAPFSTGTPQQFAIPSFQAGHVQTGPGVYPRAPFGTDRNPFQAGVSGITEDEIEFKLPSLFQYPKRFLSKLQAQIVSGNAKVLTDPTLIVQEGQTANVNLTQEVVGNIERVITDTAGGSRETLTVKKENVGLTLGVKIERVDDNGFVSLSVAPVVKAPQAPAQTPNGQVFLVSERSLNSGLIRLRDNQTLILSGIIQDSDRTNVRKIPILGDLPLIGSLFRSTNRENQRQEVIVLLTPQVIDDSEHSSSFGHNYKPGADARQMLERQGSRVPANHP